MVNAVKETSDQIVNIAFDEFSRSGNISMRHVGAALNVSAPALYHHFRNKEALLNAVADRAFSMFEKRLRTIESRTASHTVREILDRYRHFAADHPHLFGLMFVQRRPGARKFPRDFAAHRLAVFNLLWRAVEELMSLPPNQQESLYAAHDLWALAHGQILLWRAGRFENETAFDESFERAINRFLGGL